jgi:hypothetical protein
MLMFTKYTSDISRLSLGNDLCSHKFLSNSGMTMGVEGGSRTAPTTSE